MDARSDPDLLTAMSRGDESAARTLHARIGPRLIAYARALLRDDALAEDAVQQAWMTALTRGPAELGRVRDAMGWMVRITRTNALNLVRSRSRAAVRDRLRLVSDGAPSHPPALGSDLAALHAALDTLGDDHREIVLLRHVAGLTFDQIAAALDENRSTLASRYRAAIEQLRTRPHLDGRASQNASPISPPPPFASKEAQHA